jgi:hypothetical protein
MGSLGKMGGGSGEQAKVIVLNYKSPGIPRPRVQRYYVQIYLRLLLIFGTCYCGLLAMAVVIVIPYGGRLMLPEAVDDFCSLASFPLMDLFHEEPARGLFFLAVLAVGNAVIWGVTLAAICVALLDVRRRLFGRG